MSDEWTQEQRAAVEAIDRARAFRFVDGRRGLLSPFGKDRAGIYEITDTTRALAVRYAAAGLIEAVSEETYEEAEPVSVVDLSDDDTDEEDES
jgi:hypothetical protein